MTSDNSSYYSEDSERNFTSEEDNNSDQDDWEDEEESDEYNFNKREVFGLKVKLDNAQINNFYKIDDSEVNQPCTNTQWIRILIDDSIQVEHRDIIEKFLSKIFRQSNSGIDSENLSLPLKIKILDKKSGTEDILIFDFQCPRGDEILLSEIPSESKSAVNSLMGHLYIYKYNERGIEFVNYYQDPNVENQFGFKTWHKYTHL